MPKLATLPDVGRTTIVVRAKFAYGAKGSKTGVACSCPFVATVLESAKELKMLEINRCKLKRVKMKKKDLNLVLFSLI